MGQSLFTQFKGRMTRSGHVVGEQDYKVESDLGCRSNECVSSLVFYLHDEEAVHAV